MSSRCFPPVPSFGYSRTSRTAAALCAMSAAHRPLSTPPLPRPLLSLLLLLVVVVLLPILAAQRPAKSPSDRPAALLADQQAVLLRYGPGNSDGRSVAILQAVSPIQCGLLCAGHLGCVELRLGPARRCDLLTCADGWVGRLGACYRLNGNILTWTDAENKCQESRSGAHLSSVLSESEMKWLVHMIQRDNLTEAHIGLVHHPDPAEMGSWQFRWSDGRASRFTAWGTNGPRSHPNETKTVSIRAARGGAWVVNTKRRPEKPYVCKYHP